MKDYELLEQQARVMKMAEKHGIDDWRKLVRVSADHNEWHPASPLVDVYLNVALYYRFALGVVGGKGVFEGDVLWHYEGFEVTATNLWGQEMFNHNGRTCYLQHLSWAPPAKDEPASLNWRDVYKWMQDKGVRFEVLDNTPTVWLSFQCTFAGKQQYYRIDLSQTPPVMWREIYKTAQEFGVEFVSPAGNMVKWLFDDAFTEYQLAAAKREEPKPKTRKYLCFEDDCGKLRWIVDSNVEGIDWQRVPSEDKVVEVGE